MRDVDVFTQLLSLERPWSVYEVIFDAKDEYIGVFLRHRSNARFRCPQCGAVLPLYDHTAPRKWRHLDHGSWLTFVFASVPRVCFTASSAFACRGRCRARDLLSASRSMPSILSSRLSIRYGRPSIEFCRNKVTENVLTFCEHRITNATIEGLNSKIQSVKKTHMVTAIGNT